MTKTELRRLPSFNDFSPEILKHDLRTCLDAVVSGAGNDDVVVRNWANLYFAGVMNKRASTNIPATLRSTGLSDGSRPLKLSSFGLKVLGSASAQDAALEFCKHIITHKNGDVLLDALSALAARKVAVTKSSLKAELKARGIEKLSTNTTDHSTLKNWMILAGLVDEKGRPIDAAVKVALGVSVTEADELKSLPLSQQIFLEVLRRSHITGPGPFLGQSLLRTCLETHPDVFSESQFAKQVRDPLLTAGWIVVTGLAKGPHGGKNGQITGTQKLLDIPIERLIPDFNAAIPPDLRSKLQRPLSEITRDLRSSETYRGGLGLELLALRMIFDLGLEPRHFRLRSADTAHAEVDLIAEGAHLLFSRWTFQCKRNSKGRKVDLGDVAKEVGIAVHAKAHVIVMVTTTDFTASSIRYAEEITRSLPLQFVFFNGKVVDEYLEKGASVLQSHARKNAQDVMRLKRSQPLPEKDLA